MTLKFFLIYLYYLFISKTNTTQKKPKLDLL